MRDVQCERAGCHSERPPSMKPPSCGACGGHPIPNICAKPFGVGWRSAEAMPFGANVAFTLYECKAEREPLVRVFHNEEALVLPGKACAAGTECTLSELDAFFKAAMTRFNASCEVPTGTGVAGSAENAAAGAADGRRSDRVDHGGRCDCGVGQAGLRGALQAGKALGLAAGGGVGAAVGAAAQGAVAGARGAATGLGSLARLVWAAVPEPYW